MFFAVFYSCGLVLFVYYMTPDSGYSGADDTTSVKERDDAFRREMFERFYAEQKRNLSWARSLDPSDLAKMASTPPKRPTWTPQDFKNDIIGLTVRMNLFYQYSAHHSPHLANDHQILRMEDFRDFVLGRAKDERDHIGYLDPMQSPGSSAVLDVPMRLNGQIEMKRRDREDWRDLEYVGGENGMANVTDQRLLRILAKRRALRWGADTSNVQVLLTDWDQVREVALPRLHVPVEGVLDEVPKS